MNKFFSTLKVIKPTHWVYNLLHYKKLLHNRRAFKEYGIHKPLFMSISSKDFPDKKSTAWLDVGDSRKLVRQHTDFNSFPENIRSQMTEWSETGSLWLKGFFDDTMINKIDNEIEKIVESKHIPFSHGNRLPFANRISPLIREVTYHPELIRILNFILGKEVVPFQTLNFKTGSNQRAHSDSIHMTTYPLGYLIAVWIALEDTNENNGPLFYYPGSHKLPYLLNNDFNETSSVLKLGKKDYKDYEDVIEDIIEQHHLEKKVFLAKKGDVFIWHANLLHGGSPIKDYSLTRKSMVIHYYAKDVIKYHEITERPSLMES